MTPDADPRLQRLLGGAALAPLRQRLRRHYERGGAHDAILTLSALTPAECDALNLLIGRPARPAHSLRLKLAEISARLHDAGIAPSLHAALERLDGPIAPRAAERAAAAAAWAAVAGDARLDPRLHTWLQDARQLGRLKRLARQDAATARTLLTQAGAVLARLPAAGVPRAQLAAHTLGDAHALDNGRAVATLVLAAWRHAEAAAQRATLDEEDEEGEAGAVEEDEAEAASGSGTDINDNDGNGDGDGDGDGNDAASAGPERTRDTWARAGVLVNELARPALVLNLPAPSDLPALPWQAGEPAYLSLRWLLRTAPRWPVAGQTVFVCENPNLLAIVADQLGARAAPLVCTEGMPAAAQRTLLVQLAQAGAHLCCHADFDWAGVRIVNLILRGCPGATAWRMDARDYETALRHVASAPLAALAAPPIARWDPALSTSMRHHALAIAEEALAEELLGDLAMLPLGKRGA